MYKIIFQKPAEKFFRNLDKKDQERLAKKLKELESNPKLGKPLTGKLTGLWSLRTGDYRTIYQIKQGELLILIINIGHRKNIYG